MATDSRRVCPECGSKDIKHQRPMTRNSALPVQWGSGLDAEELLAFACMSCGRVTLHLGPAPPDDRGRPPGG